MDSPPPSQLDFVMQTKEPMGQYSPLSLKPSPNERTEGGCLVTRRENVWVVDSDHVGVGLTV